MLAITNAKVLTVTKGVIENGTVLIDQGRISQVGVGIDVPSQARVIDGTGKWLVPGFIEAHGHPNMAEEPGANAAVTDANELTNPITAHVRILDSIDPAHRAFSEMRRAGFSAVCALPGSGNLIGGVGAVFKNHRSDLITDLYIQGSEVMKMALGENPRRVYGSQGKLPSTRMGNAALLRETLFEAKAYSDQLKEAQNDPSKAPKPNFKLEALVPVIRGEMRCRIHSHRADDIQTAIRIAEEFGLIFAIEHTTDGRRIAGYLAEKRVKCVVGPVHYPPTKQESWNVSMDTPAVLCEAGVEISMSQDSSSGTRDLPMYVGKCIAQHGLSFDNALKALTINPARLLNLDSRVGSIEAGKDADIAIWNGNPFSNFSTCESILIDGVVYER